MGRLPLEALEDGDLERGDLVRQKEEADAEAEASDSDSDLDEERVLQQIHSNFHRSQLGQSEDEDGSDDEGDYLRDRPNPARNNTHNGQERGEGSLGRPGPGEWINFRPPPPTRLVGRTDAELNTGVDEETVDAFEAIRLQPKRHQPGLQPQLHEDIEPEVESDEDEVKAEVQKGQNTESGEIGTSEKDIRMDVEMADSEGKM